MKLRKPIMSLSWVQTAEKLGYDQPLALDSSDLVQLLFYMKRATEPLSGFKGCLLSFLFFWLAQQCHEMPLLQDCVISVTGLENVQRDEIEVRLNVS